MIDSVLDALKTALDAMLVDGGLLEGVASIVVGHEQPLQTADLPAISLDWAGEDPGDDGMQPEGAALVEELLSVRLYVASVPKGHAPARTARAHYWRKDGATWKGLRPALRQVLRVTADGVKFLLVPGSVRPLRKSQFPEARWTSAFEALVTARAVVART